MKVTSLSCTLLPLALAGFASAQGYYSSEPRSVETCEDRARQQGKPIDGWKLINGPYGKQCRRETVDLMCFGEQYYDEHSREAHCCDPPRSLGWVDRDKKIGQCCPEGHHYTKDSAHGRGACCPSGHIYSGGHCRPQKTTEHTGNCVDLCRSSGGPGPCTTSPVCGNEHSLGIEYGRCYVLSFSDGEQLGAKRDDATYAKGGYFQDIPFKVCRSTADCSPNGPVPHGGSFYLQDQIGRFNDRDGKPGWMSNHQGGSHMMFLEHRRGDQAAEFKGTAACVSGQCAIKLSGGPSGEHGLGPACPMENHGITWWPNKKIGLKLHFSEIRCDGAASFAPRHDMHSRSYEEL